MTKINVGDVVKLKSGGPNMTVFNIGSDGHSLACKWFAGAKAESEVFKDAMLVLVEESGGKD